MQWIFKKYDSDQILIFSRAYKLDPLFSKILFSRSIITRKQLDDFFDPDP